MTTLREQALEYASRGWYIFPLAPRSKKPFENSSGYKEATTDQNQVDRWWSETPDANIGIACGASQLLVVDLDAKYGKSVLDTWRNLGEPGTGYIVRTPHGGLHLYYKCETPPRNTAGSLGKGIDTRGAGGYVVAPPSILTGGNEYKWIQQTTLAAASELLIANLKSNLATDTTLGRVAKWWQTDMIISEGERNTRLTEYAGYLKAKGMSEDEIMAIIRDTNQQRCIPPLTSEELEATIGHSVRKWKEPLITGNFPFTIEGDSERLVARYGDEIAHVGLWRQWYGWDGHCWVADEKIVQRYTLEVVKRLGVAALSSPQDPEVTESIMKHVRRTLKSERLLNQITEHTKYNAKVSKRPEDFDTHPMLLNVANGVINLRTGELRPPAKELLITKLAPVAYDPEAICPKWESFLHEIFHSNEEMVQYIQRVAGYALTGDTREHAMFILWGSGANGKSTFLETIRAIMGTYARASSSNVILRGLTPGASSHSESLAWLAGARFVTTTELEQGKSMAEDSIKQLTGGDTISARRVYGRTFEFKPICKLFMATNYKPIVKGTGEAIWRRLRLIPFTYFIPPEKRIPNYLGTVLQDELPGVLAWAVRGTQLWLAKGLGTPPEVLEATSAYRKDSDILGDFLGQYCTVSDEVQVLGKDLYATYRAWCEDDMGIRPQSQKSFSRTLIRRGFTKKHTRDGNLWSGIGLKRAW